LFIPHRPPPSFSSLFYLPNLFETKRYSLSAPLYYKTTQLQI
jgi:hypothetical protein